MCGCQVELRKATSAMCKALLLIALMGAHAAIAADPKPTNTTDPPAPAVPTGSGTGTGSTATPSTGTGTGTGTGSGGVKPVEPIVKGILKGLHVDFQGNSASPVVDGIISESFKAGSDVMFVSPIGSASTRMVFSLKGDASVPALSIGPIQLGSSNMTTLAVSMAHEDTRSFIVPRSSNPVDSAGASISYTCLGGGSSEINMIIPVRESNFSGSIPQFPPTEIRLTWKKQCSHLGYRTGLMTNMLLGNELKYVVSNGMAQPRFNLSNQEAPLFNIKSSTKALTFSTYLASGETQSFAQPELHVSKPQMLKVTMRAINLNLKSFQITQRPSFWALELRCLPHQSGNTVVEVKFPLSDMYNPMSFAFEKSCLGASRVKMSEVEVFFLVIFLLTVACCLGGCALNFFIHGKRGVEIIPCLDRLRSTRSAVVDTVTGASSRRENYTKQDDFGVAPQYGSI